MQTSCSHDASTCTDSGCTAQSSEAVSRVTVLCTTVLCITAVRCMHVNAGQCKHTHARAYSHTLRFQVPQPALLRGCYQTASRLQQSTCGHGMCAKLPSQEQLHLVAAHVIYTFRRLCRKMFSVGSLAVHAESSTVSSHGAPHSQT